MINIKSKNELLLMKDAGKILAESFELIKNHILPGISTKELDRIIEDYIIKCGAFPSFKGQKGFNGAVDYPACCCISVNHEVIHGIPGQKVISEGDIVSIDAGALYKGFHADAARTFKVGKVSSEAEKLVRVTEESFFKGIEKAIQGNRIVDIAGAIEDHVVENGFSVVKHFIGHGIGTSLHEAPEVPNYRTGQRGPKLLEGMTIAVEPMVNCGTDNVYLLDNKWTVVTADHKLSAHYENTIAITENGPEIFTILA